MRIALAVVVLGGLLYLEALHGWVVHRVQRLDVALRQMRYATEDFLASSARLGASLQDLDAALAPIVARLKGTADV